MLTLTLRADLIKQSRSLREEGGTLGFVPTMGAFHDGHLSLMAASVEQNAHTVVSRFVNPKQFESAEDFAAYPDDWMADCRLAKPMGVDLVFSGVEDDFYPEGFATYLTQERVTQGLCGGARPGHFRGVLTVVLKLFNLIRPDVAYFGQKDAQQVAVIKRMVLDLDLGIKIRVLPTLREPDGLAMSSRNVHLSPEERQAAPVIHQALTEAAQAVAGGETGADALLAQVRRQIEAEPRATVEYIELVDPDEMTPLTTVESCGLIAVAARLGTTRLIDNQLLGVPIATGE